MKTDESKLNRAISAISTQLLSATSFWMLALLMSLIITFGLISPNNVFLSANNMFTIALGVSQLGLISVGTCYLLGAGQLDISIGSNITLSSILCGKTVVALAGSPAEVAAGIYPNLNWALSAGALAAVASGATFGWLNGVLVTRLRLNSFIVTLATTGIGLGAALVISGGSNVPYIPRVVQTGFSNYRVGGVVPLPVLITIIVATILWFILRRTRYGTWTLAIGSSREASARAGIDVNRHILSLYILMGVLCGASAILDIARFASTNIGGHRLDALQAISAAVIGGTSLFGGTASVFGALVGALIPAVLGTGLVIIRTDPFYQLIIVGVIIIVAVFMDQKNRERNI